MIELRKNVYKKIFKGKSLQPQEMYINQGYRGLSCIPYPNHIIELIYDINKKTKKVDPDHSKTIIYKGSELIPNFDKMLVKIKKEAFSP